MNRNAGSAQLVAAMADRINVQRLVVVAVIVDLRGLAAVDARLILERQQLAGDYGAVDFALTDGAAERRQSSAVPTPLGVMGPLFDLTAGRARYVFGGSGHLARLRLSPKVIGAQLLTDILAARDFFNLDGSVGGVVFPEVYGLVAYLVAGLSQGSCQSGPVAKHRIFDQFFYRDFAHAPIQA